MADVLGVVASGIAVFELTGKAVAVSFKLKSLWKEVKNLPVTLLEKAEELQDLDEFLRDAESHAAGDLTPNSVWNRSSMQKALGDARAAVDDFQRTLDMHIDSLAGKQRRKRNITAAKIVLQKGSLEAMEQKLDRALRFFRIAQNHYCMMCVSIVVERLPKPPDESDADDAALVIVEQFPQSADKPDTVNAEVNHFVKSEDYFHEFTRFRRSHLAKPFSTDAAAMSEGTSLLGRLGFGFGLQNSHISFRTPRWLGNSVYSFMAQKSTSGWQLNLSCHAVIKSFPRSIRNTVKSDDIINLQKSLRQTSLTPYAHTQIGQSLLYYAAYYSAVEVSRWLLIIGLYPGSFGETHSTTYFGKGPTIFYAKTPLERLLICHKNSKRDFNRSIDILRTLTAYAPDSAEDSGDIWTLAKRNRTFEQYRKFQQVMSPDLLSAPFVVRLRHCLNGLLGNHWTFDDVTCILPEVRSFSAELTKSFWLMSSEWFSLSHLMAIGVGWELLELNGKSLQPLGKGSYCSLIGDIARSSPDDLSLFLRGKRKTPLMAMVETICSRCEELAPEIFDRVLQSAITSWASILHVNGVNLLDYGCRERFSELQYREGRIPCWREGKVRRYNYIRILGITYGALPEQWKVWWSIYDYEYAGDFWRMVETSAFSIPGSWEDDFDSRVDPLCPEQVPWDDEDRGDWIVWSEYRRNRPPC